MADIFISYKSARQSAAKFLAEFFEGLGYSTWWDFNLIAGEHFPTRLQEELDNAKVVLVLWCSQSVTSRYVLDEANAGLRDEKLIPVQIEPSRLPLGFGG